VAHTYATVVAVLAELVVVVAEPHTSFQDCPLMQATDPAGDKHLFKAAMPLITDHTVLAAAQEVTAPAVVAVAVVVVETVAAAALLLLDTKREKINGNFTNNYN